MFKPKKRKDTDVELPESKRGKKDDFEDEFDVDEFDVNDNDIDKSLSEGEEKEEEEDNVFGITD